MKTTIIPIPYARIVHQLKLEAKHGDEDLGHESLRRKTYAEAMLDQFGWELDTFQGTAADFRSKVLTPVLQRQLKGVSDAYAPSIRYAIAPPTGKPTISEVTTFYLGNDPLDPRYIPSYWRNLVYIREARWHLGILMGKISMESREDFNLSLSTHDIIMETLAQLRLPVSRGVPLFNEVEVAAIVHENLETFFERELSRVVCSDDHFLCGL